MIQPTQPTIALDGMFLLLTAVANVYCVHVECFIALLCYTYSYREPTELLLLKPIVSCLLPSFPVYYFFWAKLIQKTLTNYDVNEVKITVITLQIRSN